MKTKKIHLTVLGMVIAVLAAMPAAPALAGDRDDDRDGGRQNALRHDAGADRGGVIFHLGFGRPAPEQAPGHFETRIERVLVEEGHFVTQTQQVLVSEGYWEDRYVPAVIQTQRKHGRLYTVVLAPARAERIWVPAVYETRTTRVWCPARYEDREVRVWVPAVCIV